MSETWLLQTLVVELLTSFYMLFQTINARGGRGFSWWRTLDLPQPSYVVLWVSRNLVPDLRISSTLPRLQLRSVFCRILWLHNYRKIFFGRNKECGRAVGTRKYLVIRLVQRGKLVGGPSSPWKCGPSKSKLTTSKVAKYTSRTIMSTRGNK